MILITRPRIDSITLEKKLNELSLNYVALPVIKITYNEIIPQFSKFNELTHHLIITSKNALRSIENIKEKRFTLNIVGKKTADYARSLGFNKINIIAKNARDLIEKIENTYANKSQFLYLRGSNITINLKEILARKNFIIHDLICYKSEQELNLENELSKLFSCNNITIILFFSKKTAIYFLDIVQKLSFQDKLSKIVAITMSDNISSYVSCYEWKKIITSDYPSENNMIDKILENYDERDRK